MVAFDVPVDNDGLEVEKALDKGLVDIFGLFRMRYVLKEGWEACWWDG